MLKFLLLVGVLALCGMGARAQRIEVFTGFSYGQFNPGANLTQTLRPFGRHFSMPGLEASGQLNLHSWLGVVADVSYYGGTGDVDFTPEHARIYNYLAGPQLTARHIGPFNVFVGGLVGTTNARVSFPLFDTNGNQIGTVRNKETRLAYGVGGGIDANVSSHVALRLVQIDYLRDAFTNCAAGSVSAGQCAAQAGHQDNYRAAAGFVWHF